MTQYAFGIAAVIGKRTDVTGQPPLFLGTISDINLDFDRKIETLLGQYNVAVAVGGGELKISGKAKQARFQANILSNGFLGNNTSTVNVGQMLELAVSENHVIPSSPGPYLVTVSNSSGWTEDLGAYYGVGGVQLAPQSAGLSAAGQYSYSAGVYTFFSLDAGASVNIFYNYSVSVSGASQVSLVNSLMGPVPTFELNIKESFNYFGTNKNIIIKLNQCVSPKLSWPFTNAKFEVQEFDWQCFADQSNNIGTISMTE